jgi:hypothetical protein
VLVCADDVNLPGVNINIVKKNKPTLIDAGKEVGLEVNTEKTKQNGGQNHDIKVGNRYVLEMWNSSDIWERL